MGRRGSGIAALVAIATVGCGDESSLYLALPAEGAAAQSAIVVLEAVQVSAFVVDLSRRAAITLPVELRREQEQRLHLLLYERPIDLPPGPLPLIPEGGRRLLDAWPGATAFASALRGGEASPWTVQDPPSDTLASLRVATPLSRCDRYRITHQPLAGSPAGAVVLTSTAVLLATRPGRAFLLTAETVREIAVEPAQLPLLSMVRDATGEIWAGVLRSGLWRGRFDGGRLSLRSVSSSTRASSLVWLATSGPGEPFEIFGLNKTDGTLFRGDGSSLEPIASIPWGPGIDRAGVARAGPGQAVIVRRFGYDVYRVRDGALSVERLSLMLFGMGMSTAAFVPGIGVLLGADNGMVFQYADVWMPRFDTTAAAVAAINGINPFEDGYTAMGEVLGIETSSETCTRLLPDMLDVEAVFPLGPDLVGFTDEHLVRFTLEP